MTSHYVTAEPETINRIDPDDQLSIYSFVLKWQLPFTKHFGPSYAFGITDVTYTSHGHERLVATARVRPTHQPIKGKTCEFEVPYGKFLVWRKNVKLFKFIADKK